MSFIDFVFDILCLQNQFQCHQMQVVEAHSDIHIMLVVGVATANFQVCDILLIRVILSQIVELRQFGKLRQFGTVQTTQVLLF